MSPCAACKLLRRRCEIECVFAPYFPPDQPQKFAGVHRIFGASNVNKMLRNLPVNQRADAVSSMVYEAHARIRDPVYGCVGAISSLQQQVSQLQSQLALAEAEAIRLRMLHQAAISLFFSDNINATTDALQQLGLCPNSSAHAYNCTQLTPFVSDSQLSAESLWN